MDIVRRARLQVKVLALAFRVWQYKRKVRALKSRLEEYMVKNPGDQTTIEQFLAQLKFLREQDRVIQVAVKAMRASGQIVWGPR